MSGILQGYGKTLVLDRGLRLLNGIAQFKTSPKIF
jgi:hypothetical protein